MALDLRDCTFFGPALPEPFVKFQLEGELAKRKLLPRAVGDEGRALEARWDVYRRKLRALGEQGGDRRVASHVLEPLAERLGYRRFERESEVITREGPEDGGWLLTTDDNRVLRTWAVGLGTDLDAPTRRGRAYRFSPSRVAQRVLLAKSERVGLLTDGEELRLLLCDPARPDSHIAIRLDRSGGWRSAVSVPDSYRLLLALTSPAGVAALPDLADAARLAQSTVTRKLRLQARRAIEGFIQDVLDHPANEVERAAWTDPSELARTLWREGLVLVYRLLFVFKLESSADPARAFSFAATSLWRNTYSPNTALAPLVRRVLDHGADSGGFLENGLRTLWRLFAEGMSSSELEVKALGGMLFGEGTTPLLDRLRWGERAVARLLDALLWTPTDGRSERERVHYGALDVEDLGRVYEALLELEPGITIEPMCRLRRAKLEVVVPAAQGAAYRTYVPVTAGDDSDEQEDEDESSDENDAEDGEEETRRRSGSRGTTKTAVQFVEDIPAHRFFLRVGLGRKATGSYYTPHPFVRFLVQETLGPQLAERSPKENPQPGRILELKVLDPAMGSGHFLVEACRYLGDALYESCRLCDELALQAEEQAEKASGAERERLLGQARDLRKRVEDLPDPENEMVAYLPSRAAEGEETGLSQKKAEALCRRLVAVHCLYGVDKNPLAVELAKLSLWLESYAEGLPLTFMNHRLVMGDSLTGPFFEHLLTYPRSGAKLDDLFAHNLTERLLATLTAALSLVQDLEASVGKDVADLEQKRLAKEKLDAAMKPLADLAAAWSGGVMLGDDSDDSAYLALAQAVARSEDTTATFAARPKLRQMLVLGRESVAFDLVFPEVFRSVGGGLRGFDAVLGNPPWDRLRPFEKEYFAGFDIGILDAKNARARSGAVNRLITDERIRSGFEAYKAGFGYQGRIHGALFPEAEVEVDGVKAGRGNADAYILFGLRAIQLAREGGLIGLVLPSAFHANEGAAGLRRRFLMSAALRSCFSFENRRKLFEIHSSFKFATVVAQVSASVSGGYSFQVRFYLHDMEWLFATRDALSYDIGFVEATGGNLLSLVELRSTSDLAVARRCHAAGRTFGSACSDIPLRFSVQADVTRDSWRFVEWDGEKSDIIPLHEGKTLHQYNDHWLWPPRYGITLDRLADKKDWLERARYYRVCFRGIASSTNERTAIFCMLPPGSIVANSAPVDACPSERSNTDVLALIGIMNSFTADWCLRIRASANVNQFILNGVPVAGLEPEARGFLSHGALRLSCNHAGYGQLWIEQMGGVWREPKPQYEWPVLESEDVRWATRAALDAVVADAYGLDRVQYVHVLSTFNHKSNPELPALCLGAFDELKSIGPRVYLKKHDPYWDLPLSDSLPPPAVDLPGASDAVIQLDDLGPLFHGARLAAGRGSTAMGRKQSAPDHREAGDDAYKAVVELLGERGVISSRDVQAAMGLDAAGVRPLLRRLVEDGHAVVEGERRGMKYRRARNA